MLKWMEDERWNRETLNEMYCENMQANYSEQCLLDVDTENNEVKL